MSNRELKDIENDGKPNTPIYLRFTNHVIDRTDAYAGGEVNVDVDHYDVVVGIEMLSLGANALKAFAEIVQRYDLDVSSMFSVGRK